MLLVSELQKSIGGPVMFDTFFHYPRIIARHRAGPAAEERERFLEHCASTGAAQQTLAHLASELLLVARRMKVGGNKSFTVEEINAAADRWVRYQQRHHRIRDPKFCRQRFVQAATSWFRFLARLHEPEPETLAGGGFIFSFSRYMGEERCLFPRTIQNQAWHVHAVLRLLEG